MIQTICKYCVFAKFETGDMETRQIDCSMNRIEQFRNAGVEIKEQTDEGITYRVIQNRRCNYARIDIPGGLKFNEFTEQIKEEERFKADLIISTKTLVELLNELIIIMNWSILPENLIIINNELANHFGPQQIIRIINEIKYPGKWKLISAANDNISLYQAAQKIESPWFIYTSNTSNLDPNILFILNNQINEKMERFIMVYSDEFAVFHTLAYQSVACSKEELPLKSFLLLDFEQKTNMVKKWEDLI